MSIKVVANFDVDSMDEHVKEVVKTYTAFRTAVTGLYIAEGDLIKNMFTVQGEKSAPSETGRE